MSTFEPLDPDFETRVRESFARQAFMRALGAELLQISPGEVHLALAHKPDLTQQHGYFHGGVIATIAVRLRATRLVAIPKGTGVLTAEFKINLLRPAQGERLVARTGRRAGGHSPSASLMSTLRMVGVSLTSPRCCSR